MSAATGQLATYQAAVTDVPLESGGSVKVVTLSTPRGHRMQVLDVGATLHSLLIPDAAGALGEVVCGHEKLSTYFEPNTPYLGATVGRYSNRLAGGTFVVDGKRVNVTRNYAAGAHTLHGGSVAGAFHTQRFAVVSTHASVSAANSDVGRCGVKLVHTSPHGSEGFPGTVTCAVEYTLTGDGEVTIDMSATTADHPTVISLCNHAYWNLTGSVPAALDAATLVTAKPIAAAAAATTADVKSGGGAVNNVLAHTLSLEADARTELATEFLIPTGKLVLTAADATAPPPALALVYAEHLRSPARTAEGVDAKAALSEAKVHDFAVAKALGRDIAFFDGDTASGGGYDLNYVVRRADYASKAVRALVPCATLTDPVSGRQMRVSTTAPGVQLYTGNWMGGTKGHGGAAYPKFGGVCLETQHFPDSPNHSHFPSALLLPGQLYRNVAVHAFSVKSPAATAPVTANAAGKK